MAGKERNIFLRIILRLIRVKQIIAYTKQKQFLNYSGISWYNVLDFYWRWVDAKDLRLRSTSLSFSFFMALFPSIIFVFTLIAYLPIKNMHERIMLFFENLLPDVAFNAVHNTLLDILKTQHSGLLSIGFVTAIYFSTNGFVSLMNAFNKVGQKKETRSYWKKRIVAIILAIVVSISLLIAVGLLTIGNFTIKYLDKLAYFPSKVTPALLFILNLSIVSVLILFFVSLIYYLAPNSNKEWKFFTPGSIFASVSIIITTLGFSTYINIFNTYNKIYGSIGVLIFILLLIYFNTYILLLGYEFNVAIDKAVIENKLNQTIAPNKIKVLDSKT
ncbi:MAG: YihY/virulence factor BrkB family protein [Bacteroidia bacterium]|nr:YihY/virulence factor BrkB family protein [Bacteroidia bacterium]MCC7534355.1 YihY/virulence factor BrkB family protein [Bacteroidia bacterium]